MLPTVSAVAVMFRAVLLLQPWRFRPFQGGLDSLSEAGHELGATEIEVFAEQRMATNTAAGVKNPDPPQLGEVLVRGKDLDRQAGPFGAIVAFQQGQEGIVARLLTWPAHAQIQRPIEQRVKPHLLAAQRLALVFGVQRLAAQCS